MTKLKTAIIVAALAATAYTAFAQALPTPQQAQQMLQASPDLVNQLRQRIGTSGMTQEQIRSRLRAEGYPENMFDGYLGTGGANPTTVSSDIFDAVRALGIADSADVADLMALGGLRTRGERTTKPTAAELAAARRDSIRRYVRVPGAADTTLDAASAMIFGGDVFRSTTTQFLPNLDGPVDANYRLGPGDRLVLILTGEVELAHTLDVTREGAVVIPQVGQLQVASLTMAQLQDLLYARLGRVYSGVRRTDPRTHFSVSVARLRSNQIYVLGEVAQPGAQRISSAGTALTALYASGGPTERGSLRNVQIRRGNSVVATLDLYDYLLRGDASKDPRLENGDIVFVPVHGGFVRITGEVTRPATYEMKDGETLADLITAAGGLTAEASRRRITIERVVPTAQRLTGADRTTINLAADNMVSAGVPSMPVQPFDIVHVYRIDDRVSGRVVVKGNVRVPGPQGIAGPTTLSRVLASAGGLKGDSYLGHVLISRLRDDSTRVQLRATLRDTLGTAVDDLPILEDDEITVFSRTDLRSQRFVSITGAVRSGGQHLWREGMTLRDLVLLAGGTDEGAYLVEAEVARLPVERLSRATATTLRVPLDSSYLFDRAADGRYLGVPGVATKSSGAAEFALLPYDNVLILRQPDWQMQRTVALTGEVKFPGTYAVRTKDERIVDLIERAGGLTVEANIDGAVFMRRLRATAFQVRDTVSRTVAVTVADSLVRIGVDLARAAQDRRSPDNLLLAHGDSVDIPMGRSVVEIRGAVSVATTVAWTRNARLESYINAAGGASSRGVTRQAYVTQPNGKIEKRRYWLWVIRRDPTPRAGATVTVPMKELRDTGGSSQTMMTILQTLASLAATVAILRQ